MRLVWVVFALVFVSIMGIQESFAEQIPSPRQQLEDGVIPDDIQCKDNHVLVLRTNGNVACVTERTVERTGWKIIETVNAQSIPVITEKTIEIIPKEKTSWISSATDLSYMDLEKIPNPEGYWVPIQDKDAFARALVNATGEEITNENKYGNADYFTTNGRINISPYFDESTVWSPVSYRIYELESIKSESEQLPFINNFMNNMGFKLNGNTLSLTESFLETCEGEYLTSCTIGNGTIFKFVDSDHISYTLSADFSKIRFTFFGKSHAYYHSHVIHIEFDGWTNHPELIEHPLDKNIAVEKAREFVLADEYLNKPVSEGGTCEMQIRSTDDYFRIYNFVIGGIPFYGTNIAKCTYDPINAGHFEPVLILVDALTGEYVFRDYIGGLD